MPDIFSRQRTGFGGSFASDVAALTIAGSNTALGIVQNVGIQFNQNVARIYDVSNGGTAGQAGGLVPVFYVGGRTQGQASIARVLGPQSGALSEFYTQMSNICSPQDLTFTFRGGCEAPGQGGGNSRPTKQLEFSNAVGNSAYNAVAYTVEAAVSVGMSINVGATDMIVNESISLMFANLKCDPFEG
jgi:hypothetical protein